MITDTPERLTVAAVPRTNAENVLEECFYKDLAAQAERFDKFALELIKLQLAIPALYAAMVKLTQGDDAKVDGMMLFAVLMVWLFAMILSFLALFPARKYQVNTGLIIEENVGEYGEAMGISTYFRVSAKRKLRLLVVSCFLSFLGITLAVYSHLL